MQKNEVNTEKATKNPDWNGFENWLASEIIVSREKISQAKDIGIVCITVVACVAIGGLLAINHAQNQKMYDNDSQWRTVIEKSNQSWIDYLSQYDFVNQDGEGINYYNSDVGGNVNNGAESPSSEE